MRLTYPMACLPVQPGHPLTAPPRLLFAYLAITLVYCGCARPSHTATRGDDSCPWRKLDFSLTQLDSEGLVGPADGKVALDYAFCLPMRDGNKNAVMALDSTLVFYPPIDTMGCGQGHWLVMGNTHKKQYRAILCAVAQLEDVPAIWRVFWE